MRTVISVRIEVDPDNWAFASERTYEQATAAVLREYRKESGSRRHAFIWRWNTDGYLSDGSGVNLHGTLVGRKTRTSGGYPVLAECWAYIRKKKEVNQP